MLALFTMMLFPLLFLLGTGVTRILYGHKGKGELFWEDRFLAGILVLIGLAEGAHLGSLARGQSLLDFKKFFLALLCAAAAFCFILLAVGWVLQKRKDGAALPVKEGRKLQRTEIILLVCFFLIAASQVLTILLKTKTWQDRNLVLETVVSFLQTGKLYEINPLTGVPYAVGLPTRLKILCLPTLYAWISMQTGASPELVTWHLIPAVVAMFFYLAYYSLARTLFPKDGRRQITFLLLVSVLAYVGDYAFGMEGFGLLHAGFLGESVRAAILMPYLFSLCLRRKWRLAVCVAAAEACIVWTTYGIGMAVLVILCFLAIGGVRTLILRRKEGS